MRHHVRRLARRFVPNRRRYPHELDLSSIHGVSYPFADHSPRQGWWLREHLNQAVLPLDTRVVLVIYR